MDLYTARWQGGEWSTPLPEWDGPGTLVLVFGAADLHEVDTPLREVVDAFPRSAMMGCSTAGEILNASVYDGCSSTGVPGGRT